MRPTIRRILILGLLAGANMLWALPRYQHSDLLPFAASGRAVLDGRNPYQTPEVEPGITPTLTPPYTLPLLSLIGPVEHEILYPVWWTVSLALYLLILAVLLRAYPERRTPVFVGWTLAYMPLWSALRWGQVYVLLLALATVAWLALQHQRPIVAGVALGLLIATKPNFTLWPALLFLAGLHLPSLIAFGVAGLLTLAPLFWYGPGILLAWLNAGAVEAMTRSANYMELTLRGFGTRLGLPWFGVALALLLVLWLAWWAWRKRPDVLTLSRQALIGSLLAAPLMWPGYAIVLLPIWLHARWTWPVLLAGAAFVVPHELPLLLSTPQAVAQILPLRIALWSIYMAALVGLLLAPWLERVHLPLTRLSAPRRTGAPLAGYSPPSARPG